MREIKVVLHRDGPLTREDYLILPSGESLLVCRASVLAGEADQQYWLALANEDVSADVTLAAVCAGLGTQAQDDRVLIVRRTGEGWAEAISRLRHDGDFAEAAAAIAAMRSSWGWDESSTIAVQIDGQAVETSARYDGEYWSVLVP
jgi:hypothetical protein